MLQGFTKVYIEYIAKRYACHNEKRDTRSCAIEAAEGMLAEEPE